MHYILFFDGCDDLLSEGEKFWKAHLHLARATEKRGDLVITESLMGPGGKVVLTFTSQSSAENLPKMGPYNLDGLAKSHSIRRRNAVVGPGAVPP